MSEEKRMDYYIGTDGEKHPLPPGTTLADIATQMMAQFEKDLCERDPEAALAIGQMQKDRLEFQKKEDERIAWYLELSRKCLASHDARFDPMTELKLQHLREYGDWYRTLPDGGSMPDPDFLEWLIRGMISSALVWKDIESRDKATKRKIKKGQPKPPLKR